MSNLKAAVIAGTHSGVGKTTWSLALMSYFKRKALAVQPFKIGPDYIDPGFHHLACGPRRSRNLDRFFLSEDYLKQGFEQNSAGADLALVEGVMGLFDGQSPHSEEGSTAQMAKLLSLPVFLVIDGSGLSRSAAALVKGYQGFDPELPLRGILINRVSSEGHFRWLKDPIEKETGVPVLGWLPPEAQISIPERHLGLRTAAEEGPLHQKLNLLAEMLEKNFNSKLFLDLSSSFDRPGVRRPAVMGGPEGESRENFPGPLRCRIGVAFDKAFSFYYEDNLDLLRKAGAELVFFSPLKDSELPPDLQLLYLGGGFPELYARDLSENRALWEAVRRFHADEGLIYAECGGLMVLAESLEDPDGKRFPMAGFVPGTIRMTHRLQNFGYKELECRRATFLFPEGKKLRSHEFHYSTWEREEEGRNFEAPYQVRDRRDGFYDGRLLASYQHLHFGQDRDLAGRLVRSALVGGLAA